MRRGVLLAAAVAITFSLLGRALAQDLATVSDLDLLDQTREAVGVQDADLALELLIEMQRRGTGIFAGAERAVCEEVIVLPDGITDWKFHAVARQAYIRSAMSRRLEDGSCGCLFADFSFDAFVQQSLGKPAADLMNADREALAKVRDQDRRETEARYRDLEQSCRAE
jgi:hypothetical protein